jgi:hypothetical protein
MSCILTLLLLPVSCMTPQLPVSWPLYRLCPASQLPLFCHVSWLFWGLLHLSFFSLYPDLYGLHPGLYGLYPGLSAALYPVLVHPLLPLSCSVSWAFLRPFTLNLLQPVSWPLLSVSWPLSCVYPDPSAAACILTSIWCLRPDISAECILTPSRPSHLIWL